MLSHCRYSWRIVAAARLRRWLEELLWEAEEDTASQVLRMKGIVHVIAGDGMQSSHNVQAVRELYDITERGMHASHADAQSRLVLIGRRLDACELQAGFSGCVAAA